MVIGLALITYPPRMTLPDPSDFPVRAVPLAPLTKERATIVCRRNGRVLLVARRQALRWTLPGGVIRRGESALAHAAGPAARPVLVLGWALLALCALVCVTIAVLLFGALVYMLRVLAVVAAPPRPPALTIGVTAHDWWWAVRYPADADGAAFVTANEIHIPVGEPVLVELTSADVIHAFWVPQLAGKTQTIPGQTNRQWLQADRPGVYRGQCSQYCGAQHAHMAFEVVAEPPAAFRAWLAAQRQPAPADAAAPELRGRRLFTERCAGCHAVRGTGATGDAGPDLTHVGSRRLLAAGTLENTPANLRDWIAHAQQRKPQTLMPSFALAPRDADDLAAYLATLH
ncbi:cytochrome c oxidase subunit 2 [Burkholderia vietnamiensis]|nr:cytochrome c oxidase subunit 2 [Burkholderia vietnamiensis]SFX78491.1 cytochrome c oxidase subunit 2 [Burkholderia vietnamiensis]